MMEFELERVWGGWENAYTPDNLEITLRTGHTEHHMVASIKEILEIYGDILNEECGSMYIGTGKKISIVVSDGCVYFKKTPICREITFGELRDSIESLLIDIFNTVDDRSDSTEKRQKLSLIQDSMEGNIKYDILDSYEKLSSSNESG